jgi:hypothetical protein
MFQKPIRFASAYHCPSVVQLPGRTAQHGAICYQDTPLRAVDSRLFVLWPCEPLTGAAIPPKPMFNHRGFVSQSVATPPPPPLSTDWPGCWMVRWGWQQPKLVSSLWDTPRQLQRYINTLNAPQKHLHTISEHTVLQWGCKHHDAWYRLHTFHSLFLL